MVADGVQACDIDAILFDMNGTIIDLETEDWGRTTLGGVALFFRYNGVHRRTSEVVEFVRGALRAQIGASHERQAEFDAVRLWAPVFQIQSEVEIEFQVQSEVEIEDVAVGIDAGVDNAEEMTHSRTFADPIAVNLPKGLSDPGSPLFLAQSQRLLSLRRLQPYARVGEVLTELRTRYCLGIVSDA